MGGSGGGGPFVSRSPEELAALVRKEEDSSSVAAFETELSTTLAELLGDVNGRDVDLVQERLDDIKEILKDSIEGTLDQRFGGSVAKHTYVDGLSDIDTLLIINGTELDDLGPSHSLNVMAKILEDRLGSDAAVSQGAMAITVDYSDHMKIQLLPAIRTKDGKLRVPSASSDRWSNISPANFSNALTQRNEACGRKLVPVIKLAKAINGTLPEQQRLSGYHIESLAIAAFRNYQGPNTTVAMLPRFFERAKELVLSPIRDSTGQSVHVDSYLGPANSEARLAAGHIISRIQKRMHNASAGGSTAQWRALFGLDE